MTRRSACLSVFPFEESRCEWEKRKTLLFAERKLDGAHFLTDIMQQFVLHETVFMWSQQQQQQSKGT